MSLRRRTFRLFHTDRLFQTATVVTLLALTSSLLAHPIEYHQRPLDTATVERVLDSLDHIVIRLRLEGALEAARLPDDAMGITAVLWSMEDALLAIDGATLEDSEALNEALAAAGYARSPTAPLDWQLEAERVLETYEVLARGLDMDTVDAGFVALELTRSSLPDETALEREGDLYRDQDLVLTTWNDLHLVQQYRERLDRLILRLGARTPR